MKKGRGEGERDVVRTFSTAIEGPRPRLPHGESSSYFFVASAIHGCRDPRRQVMGAAASIVRPAPRRERRLTRFERDR
jgi:hypothetical protein